MKTPNTITGIRRGMNQTASALFCTGIGILLSLVSARPLVAAEENADYADLLSKTRLFNTKLSWVGQTSPNAAESQRLWQAFGVGQYTNMDQALDGLEAFIQANPNSPWTASLHANLGKYYFDTVRFTLALGHFEAAWQSTKEMSNLAGRQIADAALTQWLRLLTSLGRTETLKTLVDETVHRQILQPFQPDYRTAREAYDYMLKHPAYSYRCGTFALSTVAQQLYKTNNVDILTQLSPQTGFSMASLWDLSQRAGLDLVPVQRISGTDLIVPSVVHWRQNHYAAIVAVQGNLYKVLDPTFRMSR